jgi:hypothetical protein
MKKNNNIILLLLFCSVFSNLNSKNYALAKRGVSSKSGRIDLNSSSSQIILDSNDEITSDIYLNGGSARLEDNSKFVGDKFFKNSGIVNLQTYELSLGRYENTITSTIYWDGTKGSVLLDGRTYLTSTWTFSGECMLDGHNNILDLTNTGSIVIERGSTLKLKNLRIAGLHGENINNLNDSCHLVIENVTLDLSGDFDFNSGTCEIYNFVDINGTYTFFYDSSQTITIHKNTTCEISRGLNWAIRTKDWSAGNKPFWFTDKSSEVRVDSAGILVGPAGINFTRGWMGVHGKIDLRLTGTTQETGFKIGDGTSNGDFEIVFYPASTVKAYAGAFIVDCINPYSIKSLSGFSKLHRLANNDFYIKRNFVMDNLSVYIQTPTNMYVDDGAVASYQDCKFMFDGVKFGTTSSRYLDSVLLLSGDQEIFIEEGKLPLYAMVSGTGNKVHGSGSMQGKIIFSGSGSELTYGLDSEMLNDIDLNYGSLILDRDLVFSGGKALRTQGIVNLQSNDLIFNGHELNITSTVYFDGNDGSVNLNSSLFLSSQWTFSGDCILNGNGNILDLTNTGSLIIEKGSTLKFKDIHLINLSSENINALDDNCHVILDNVVCDLNGDFYFNSGTCEIYNYLDINGTYTFYYDSIHSLTIHKQTIFEVSKGVTLALRTINSTGGKMPFWFESNTSEIKFNNSIVKIGDVGARFTRGVMSIEGQVNLDITSTGSENGVFLGNGNSADDFSLIFYPASTYIVSDGSVIIDNVNPNTIVSLSDISTLKRLSGNDIYISNDFNLSNLTIWLDSPTNMYVDESADANYSNCRFYLSDYGVQFVTTSKRYLDSVLSFDGDDEIILEKGNMPLYIFCSGTNNKFRGNGSMSGVTTLLGSGSELSLELNGYFRKDIILNGGKIILEADVDFTEDKFFQSAGIVNLGLNKVGMGPKDYLITTTIYWDGQNGELDLKSKILLTSQWTFSGDCILNGNGNILDLTNTGSLIIERASTLRLKNLHIVGLNDENINNLDDNCHLIFDNVVCDLKNDFNFNCGSAEIYNFVDLNGTYTFFYDSIKTLTIHSNTICEISKDLTFAIRTKDSSGGNKPFWFEDSTAKIEVQSAHIKTGSAGVLFTRGSLGIHGKADFEVSSTDSTNGLTLGDGTDEGNFYLIFNPASTMVVHDGYYVINSTDPRVVQSLSGFSKLHRLAGNIFYIKNNFIMNNLSVYLQSPTEMIVEDGAVATYEDCKFMFSGVKFGTTSSRYSDYVLALGGNEEIFIEEGLLPLYAMVSGTGNKIHGTGSMEGQIIMAGPGSEVNIGLDGQILNDIQLNYAKVILDRDVNFARSSFFTGQGTVNLQNKNLKLGSASQTIDSQIYFDGSNGQISLNSDVDLDTIWTFSGYCTLDGKNHILDLTSSGTLYVERGSTLVLKNINVYGIQNENLSCVDDSSLVVLDNCVFTLVKDFHYKRGGCKIYNYVELHGEHDLYLDTNCTMSIYNHSTFALNKGITAKLRTINTDSDRHPVWFEHRTSEFKLDTSNVELGPNGAIFTKGKMCLIGDVEIELNSTSTMNGLHVGDGTEDGDFYMVLHPASNFVVGEGDFVMDCYDSTNMRSLSSFSKFVRLAGNHFHIKNNFMISNVTMKIDMDTYITAPDGVDICFSDCNFEVDGIKFNTTSKRYGDGFLLLEGDDNIYIQEGKMPFYVIVSGLNNRIHGNGSLDGGVILVDSDSCVDISLDGQVLQSVQLNGGRCSLSKDTNFGQGVQFTTTGTVALGSSNLELGTMDINCSCTLCIDSSQGSIDLNSMITLSGSWTFSGHTTLNGHGNILNLKPSAQIKIERGSTLRLINLRIKDLATGKLQCLDDAGILVIKDCSTMLYDDFEFDKGKLFVDYRFDVKGGYDFIYSSKEQSTINKCTSFRFFPGTTFSYSPQTVDRDLMKFTDLSSKLCLDEASLHSTSTGMQLKAGTLEVNGLSYILSDAACKAEGIILGDGINENNNVNIDIIAGATLDLISGHMVYKNVS